VAGAQAKNGFFAYRPNLTGGAKILVSDINNDGQKEILFDGGGKISASKNGKIIFSFNPFSNIKLDVNFTVARTNKAKLEKQIIVGAGPGGGPQIRIFDDQGKFISQFFAAEAENRQGAYVVSYDINNDKIDEILVNIDIFN